MKKLIFVCFVFFLGALNIFAQTKESIRVGVYLDMSGQTSSFGIATHNGIKMAVDEINASGGIDGRKFEIFLEDDEGRPEKAKTAVVKLISENKVHAILGEVASTNSLAGGRAAQAAKIPMITPSSTNLSVTQMGDYIFRACFVDPFQGKAMAGFAFNTLKAKRVGILLDVNSDYSKYLVESFTKTFINFGGKVVVKEGYTQVDTDFTSQLKKIRRLKPDTVYLPGYYSQVGIIARQARQLKMNMPLLGGDGWDSPELWKLGRNALNNSFITNHFAVDNPAAKVQIFAKNFKTKFNVEPDAIAALGYDTVYILADALKRAKTTDSEKLRDALAQIKDFYGVTGKINFDAQRDAIKPVVILKLAPENSKFVYHSTIQP